MAVDKPQFNDGTKDSEEPTAKSQTARKAPTTVSRQEIPEVKEDPNAKPHCYVWLANGEVLKVDEEDNGGRPLVGGHWQMNGHAHEIVAVYSVEEKTEG